MTDIKQSIQTIIDGYTTKKLIEVARKLDQLETADSVMRLLSKCTDTDIKHLLGKMPALMDMDKGKEFIQDIVAYEIMKRAIDGHLTSKESMKARERKRAKLVDLFDEKRSRLKEGSEKS
jgi:hypothetical protein